MILAKVLVMERINKITLVNLAQFTALLAVAVFAPLSHNQIITGSLVNATLFIAAATIGLEGAILIGILPSTFALLFGTLPIALAPLIPFIILSNILLILVVSSFKKYNSSLVFFSAAVLKFLFLFAVSSWAINLLFHGNLVKTASIMLSWPQLITALIGGLIALVIIKKSVNMSLYANRK
ncbi:MAG: iron hydrogenase [Patescibacteria group bacterium]|jgi:hypothetical protein